MRYVDAILNRVTMYRVVLYYLIALLVGAGIAGALGYLRYSPVAIAYSTGVLVIATVATNFVLAKVWKAVPGSASSYITALILALIVSPVPPTDLTGALTLAVIGAWASASKYLLTLGGKHVFNPAALAVALSAVLLSTAASWWAAGNLVLLPIILIGGFLTIRKIQRFDLVLSFTAAALLTVALTTRGDVLHALQTTLLHSSLLFLASIMLTEPATMPPSRDLRIAYGAIVGIWFAPAMHLGSFYFTPELALLLGNVFVFLVSPRGRLMLTLRERVQYGADTHEFVFDANRSLTFQPGQYLEWTVPEGKGTDAKGNRRYFTIASAPEEKTVRLGVKASAPHSSFKQALLALPSGGTITAAQVAGDFTLPKDAQKKLVFIAGGIGVTPFRSMVAHLLATKEKRDIVMFYSNRTAEDVAFYDVFERARKKLGIRTTYALTDDDRTFEHAHRGLITPELIQETVPDYRERTFYVSGPRSMVLAFTGVLRTLGVPSTRIKTDYFPGFV